MLNDEYITEKRLVNDKFLTDEIVLTNDDIIRKTTVNFNQ